MRLVKKPRADWKRSVCIWYGGRPRWRDSRHLASPRTCAYQGATPEPIPNENALFAFGMEVARDGEIPATWRPLRTCAYQGAIPAPTPNENRANENRAIGKGQTGRNPPSVAWRSRPGTRTGIDGRDARCQPAGRVRWKPSIARPSHRTCVVSQRLCAGRVIASQIMCVGKRPLLCVWPLNIARRYM
jgi:hypothetical protein